MAMYIRVKHNQTTYFLQCEPTDKILQLKEKLRALIDKPLYDQRLFLLPSRLLLDDTATLADEQVENDAVLALSLRKVNGEFEKINILMPGDFYQSRDANGSSYM